MSGSSSPDEMHGVPCRIVSTLLSFLVSPVALLTIILCLVGSVVLLRGANSRITSQSEQLQQDLKVLRRSQRVSHLI